MAIAIQRICYQRILLQFAEYQTFADKVPKAASQILMSKDGTKARIATKISDLGADSVMAIGDRIDAWIATNIDSSVATFRRNRNGLYY